MKRLPHVMVWGVGNPLLTDEGIGVHVVRALREAGPPENVTLVEAGTAGIELLHLLEDVDCLVIVDAMLLEGVPGDLYRFTPDEVQLLPPPMTVSAHDLGVVETLLSAELLERLPPTVIFGIVPGEIGMGLEPSPALRNRLPRIVQAVMSEIREGSSLARDGNHAGGLGTGEVRSRADRH